MTKGTTILQQWLFWYAQMTWHMSLWVNIQKCDLRGNVLFRSTRLSTMENKDPPCLRCGRLMMLIKTSPKSEAEPELQTFLCASCGDVRTIELQDE